MSARGVFQDVSRPHTARLVRISSHGSSIDSGDPHERSVYTPNHDEEGSSSDDQVMDDSVYTTYYNEGANEWIPIHQDISQASESEIQEIEAAGEYSALDHAYWEKKTFHSSGNENLLDPAISVLSSGRIDWLVDNFNGSRENPNTRFIMTSPWVFVGKYSWRIKLYPKGKESSYLSIYLECNFPEDDACEILNNPSPLIDNITLTRPRHLPASFSIVVWNPQEPRVHLSAVTEYAFTAKQPDAGWARFGSVHARDLGRRQPGQRQALLCNDTLAFTAYLRTYQDPTGSLFFNMSLCPMYNSFAATGMNALSSQHTPNNNLGAAIAAWVMLAPFRDMIGSVLTYKGLSDATARTKPLLAAFLNCIIAMSKRQADDSFVVQLDAFDQALGYYGAHHGYYGAWCAHGSDVFHVWQVLRDILEKEFHGTPQAGALRTLFGHIGFRCRLPLSTFKKFTSVGEAMHEIFTNSRLCQNQLWPKVLQFELPRYVFDRAAREWRIVSDNIKLDRTFKCAGTRLGPVVSYSLCGLITYNGSIESGSYESLARSPGLSTWYKFSNINGGRIELRTEKQALQGHCSATYILVYVRDDVPAVAPDVNAESANRPADLTRCCCTVAFDVFHCDVFIGRQDIGIVDVLNHALPESSNLFRKLRVPSNATLSQIKQELLVSCTGNYDDLRLWVLDTNHRGMKMWTPKFHRLDGDIWTAERILLKYPGCHLWLHTGKVHIYPDTELKVGAADAADIGVSALDMGGNNENGARDERYDALQGGREIALGLIAGDTMDGAANTVQDDIDEEMGNASSESGDAPIPMDVPQGAPQRDLYPHPELGFFLKLFDPLSQSLTGRGMVIARRTDSIKLTIEHLMGWQNENPRYFIEHAPNRAVDLDGHHVSNGVIRDGTIIIATRTPLSEEGVRAVRACGGIADPDDFLKYLCMAANHPELIGNGRQGTSAFSVGQQGSEVSCPVPSPGHELRELTSSSVREVLTESHATPSPRVTNLSGCGSTREIQERHYFLSEYYRGTFSRGYYHRQGHHIDKGGNEYFGNFVMGIRSGKGHMIFRNGDSYTGDWQDDNMHGNGTYVTKKNGNTYQGGFKDGSRHGRGITKWEVAQKDEPVCSICYERLLDCAFCNCGHVCACFECASQLDLAQGCPICRRPITKVMKLYF